MKAFPRERFSTEVALSPSMVAAFATAAGGPHTTALLLALTASHYPKKCAMLGFEFWVRFRRAAY